MQYLASIKSTMHLREEAYNMILHLLNDILRTDGFVFVHAADGVGKEVGDADDVHLVALLGVGNTVGENQLGHRRVLYTFSGRVAHHGMRGDGPYREGTFAHHQVGSFGDGSGGVDHIVHENYILALYIANHGHALDHIGFGALLVTKNQGHTQVLGIGAGALGTSYVGGSNHHILEIQRLDIGNEYRRSIQVIHGNIEETLNLVGVQVHRDETVDTGYAQNVGQQLGGNRNTGFVLAVLTCPTEIGNDGYNRFGRSAFGGIDHQQQFHEVVGIGEGRLHQVYLAAPNRFLEGYGKFAIGKMLNVHLA